MRESAVLTTAMSSMSIAVAAQTTASVQRCVRIGEAPGMGRRWGREGACLPAPGHRIGELPRPPPPREAGGTASRLPRELPRGLLELPVRLARRAVLVDEPRVEPGAPGRAGELV